MDKEAEVPRPVSALVGLVIGICLFLVLCHTAQANDLFPGRKNFSISNKPLNDALNEWAQTTGFAVITPTTPDTNVKAPPLEGSYTSEAALRVLLKGSPLGYCYVNSKTVAIVAKERLNSSSTNCNPDFADFGSTPRPAPARKPVPTYDAGIPRKRPLIPEIVITGYRSITADIRRARDDLQPYQIFGPEEIERSSALDINAYLKGRVSMSAGMDNALRADGYLGNASRISFRGLESDETLILVDGRHRPPFQSGGSPQQPDIAGIPLFLIEGIEILPSTASGIYGGDATGGVMNVILKRNYNGVTTDVSYGDTFNGGGASRSYSLIGGHIFGSTSVTLGLSHSEVDPLRLRDRPYLWRRLQRNEANPPLGSTTNVESVGGEPLVLRSNGVSLGSSKTFIPGNYAGIASDGGAALIANAGQFNLDMANTAQPNGGGNAALTNAPTTGMATLSIQHRFDETKSFFVDANFETNNGRFLTNRMATTVEIPANSLANPFAQAVRVNTPGFGGDADLNVDISTFQTAAGFQHKPNEHFEYGLDYAYSESLYDASSPGGLSSAGIDAIAKGEVDVMSDNPEHRVDLSPWQEARSEFTSTRTTLHDGKVSATFTPDVDRKYLPTVTAYYQRRAADYRPQSFISGPSVSSTPERRQTVNSGYLGISSQLVDVDSNIPGVRSLRASLSGRYDSYATHGGDTYGETVTRTTNRIAAFTPTFMVGLSPQRNVLLRGSVSRGFLSPQIDQVSPTRLIVFPGWIFGLTDPARGNEPVGAVQFFSGGNPDLTAERSKSMSGGVVFQAPYRGIRMSVDWTRIDVSNDIQSLLLSQATLDSWRTLPDGVILRAPRSPDDPYELGPMTGFNSIPRNLGRREIDALDFRIDANFPGVLGGDFKVSLQGTRQLRSRSRLGDSAPWAEYVGLVGLPTWKAFADLQWRWRNLELAWDTRGVDGYWLDASHQVDPILGHAKVPSQLYHDVTVRLTDLTLMEGGPRTTVHLGVTNLFNSAPPADTTAMVTGYQYSPHGDARGAAWALGFQMKY